MALSLVAVGAKVTAAIANGIIQLVNLNGLTAIIPASVAGTGVTVGPNGKVTFAAATAVSVNGCFTATYDNYLIVHNVTAFSAAGVLYAQLRASGTNLTTSTYPFGGVSNNATATPLGANGTAIGFRLTLDPLGALSASGDFEIFSPALAAAKRVASRAATVNASYSSTSSVASSQPSAVAYDGFTLIEAGGATFTGTLRIYGFNNN